ncbi:MAG: hypothetical protein AB8B72_00225 [Crocinitomicaceae bacterium]
MEKQIKTKTDLNTLDKLLQELTLKSSLECSKEYDIWDHRVDANNQMEQCIVIKKSGMHGAKLYINGDNSVKLNYIIPSKVMNAYFGKSVKRHRSILEVITGKISQAVLSGSQKKAFNEIEESISKIIA